MSTYPQLVLTTTGETVLAPPDIPHRISRVFVEQCCTAIAEVAKTIPDTPPLLEVQHTGIDLDELEAVVAPLADAAFLAVRSPC